MSKRSWLSTYFLFVVFRIINAYFLQSFGHADEFWQADEVAHRHVFGYGFLTWEWTYKEPLRSPIYFGIFSIYYYILKVLGLDIPLLVAYGPRFLHTLISGLFDLILARFGTYVTNIQDPFFWVIVNYTTWYSLFNIPRTLVNVIESALFMVTFYIWKLAFEKNKKSKESGKLEFIARALIVFTFVMRPTSIAMWAPIWLIYGFADFSFKRFFNFCLKCLATCIIMVSLSIGLDVLYHGKLTWTAFNFVYINVVENKSAQHGIYHPFWYFGAAMPLIALAWVPPLLIGVYEYTKNTLLKKQVPELVIIPCFEALFLSITPHKEDRYLMKVLPFMIIFIGIGIHKIYTSLKNKKVVSVLLFCLIFINLSYYTYAGLIDKRGSIDVMDHLRDHRDEIKGAIFFTECHRTPYYSFIHKNVPLQFPGCSPYEDNPINDSKLLFVNPSYFIQTWLEKYQPSHIIMYSQFLRDEKVVDVLKAWGFIEEKRFFNSLFVDTPVGYSFWHELVVLKRNI